MSYQSDDIDRNKILALKKILPECHGFIFDVTLDISFTADSKWTSGMRLSLIMLATIVGQIGHKYEQWKNISHIIVYTLFKELLRSKLSYNWKGTFSVGGQYVNENSAIGSSEIIYDWFTHDGFMTIPDDDDNSPPVSLQYTIRFLLSPALPIAQQMYSARGYKIIRHCYEDFWTPYNEIINTMIDRKKEYNHLEMWRANCNAYLNIEMNTPKITQRFLCGTLRSLKIIPL
ncbi:hypothetical protein PV326_011678 [Microctonus aethiopoides]|nr:hypothetical protein PV326_011678 [Microctonus aethiopoides]